MYDLFMVTYLVLSNVCIDYLIFLTLHGRLYIGKSQVKNTVKINLATKQITKKY